MDAQRGHKDTASSVEREVLDLLEVCRWCSLLVLFAEIMSKP